jgi:hypothetical protein
MGILTELAIKSVGLNRFKVHIHTYIHTYFPILQAHCYVEFNKKISKNCPLFRECEYQKGA